MTSPEPIRNARRFFAVASLGKNRWYWVVWPSLDELQAAGEPLLHIREGYEETKADAVERALATAGNDAEWIAAKHARSYHRSRANKRGLGVGGRSAGATAVLGTQEFLYRDRYDASRDRFTSVPHRVVRKTPKSVFVEQRLYAPDDRTGSWLDKEQPTYRLDRQQLEHEGYAYISVAEHISDAQGPLFFVSPRDESLSRYGRELPGCLRMLRLSWPCTAADIRQAYRRLAKSAHPDGGGSHEEFLKLQEAYAQALWICR